MTTTKFSQLLQELGAEIGLTDLAPDESGLCQLAFDGRINIMLQAEPESDRIVLVCSLGFLAAEDNIGYVAEKLLAGNLYWKETAGATLSYDPTNRIVLLAYAVDLAPVDLNQFNSIIEDFTNVSETWMYRLAEFKAEGIAALNADAPSEVGTFRV